jgi:hypothetical protein
MDKIEQPPNSEAVYNEDGVDLSLIRWMLSLTPRQRLLHVQGFAQAVQRVRNGRAAARLSTNPARPDGSRR